MSAVESLRSAIHERLTAAAEEILGAFVHTISVYEEEIGRQRRLLDAVLKPEIQLYRTELPKQHVYQEEEEEEEVADQQLSNQPSISSLEKEDPDPPHIKEEQEELCTSLREEQPALKQEDYVLHSNATCERSDDSDVWSLGFNCDENQSEAEKDWTDDTPTKSTRAEYDNERSEVLEPSSDHQLLFHTPFPQVETYHAYQRGNRCSKTKPKRKAKAPPKSTRNIRSKLKKKQNDPQLKAVVPENTVSTDNSHEKHFKCNRCSKSFNLDAKLKLHMMTHTTEKPFSCPLCGRTFTMKRYVKQHMVSHSAVKPYHCNECGKRFRRLQNLQNHMKCHVGEMQYRCVYSNSLGL